MQASIICCLSHARTHTHTRTFNGPFSRISQVSRYQKGRTNLDFTEARGSGISWARCKSAPHSRQITMPAPRSSVFLQAGCHSCRPTNSVKALKAMSFEQLVYLVSIANTYMPACEGRYWWMTVLISWLSGASRQPSRSRNSYAKSSFMLRVPLFVYSRNENSALRYAMLQRYKHDRCNTISYRLR